MAASSGEIGIGDWGLGTMLWSVPQSTSHTTFSTFCEIFPEIGEGMNTFSEEQLPDGRQLRRGHLQHGHKD